MSFVRINHIGEIYGNMKIISASRNGEYTKYDAICINCGTVIVNRTLSNIKRLPYNCKHKTIKTKWKEKEIASCYYCMLERCYKESSKPYKRYGGRGIIVCDEWLKNPNCFEEWAINNGWKSHLTIDKIDVNGNYEPSNCRWITKSSNSKSKSTTIYLSVDGISKNLNEWSRFIGKGMNYINQYRRKFGEEATKEKIHSFL